MRRRGGVTRRLSLLEMETDEPRGGKMTILSRLLSALRGRISKSRRDIEVRLAPFDSSGRAL